ncbi:MAG: AmmeMemoRadiSam system radical SAM enzyme [Candidatus Aenigmatarchaeota archaeon]
MQEAMLWHKERNGVRCDLCHARCFISKEKFGLCQVRKNENNKLYTLNYEKVLGLNVDWVEKSLLFHFLPKSKSLFVSLPGCELNDNFCINGSALENLEAKEISAEDVAEAAEKKGCKSISYSFTEPTISFEFTFKIAKYAHRANIKNIFVTNGYVTEDAVKKIAKYLDAASVRFKASGSKQFMTQYGLIPEISPVIDTLKQMKKHRIFLEIANTIIPQVGDDLEECRKLAELINMEFGSEIPFHVLQFHPSPKFPGLPATPISVLERCADVARAAGLRFVYISNVSKNPNQNTYCYNCQEPLIIRENLSTKKINLVDGRCPKCGLGINLVLK